MLAQKLAALNAQIEKACLAYDRSFESIRLIAVSKNQSFELIKQAYDLGIRDFGESYAQELDAKRAQAFLHNMPDIRWHFIGALQSNKIKLIAQADYIHSVGTLRHAELLSRVAEHELKIFLQINLDSKRTSGFTLEEIGRALAPIRLLPRLHIQGFMCIAPLNNNPDLAFALMRDLRDTYNKPGLLLELSMGMSGDFIAALSYGSNYIRIGTNLFGPRNIKQI